MLVQEVVQEVAEVFVFFVPVVVTTLGHQFYSWWRERRRAEGELRSDYARYYYLSKGLFNRCNPFLPWTAFGLRFVVSHSYLPQ